MVGGHDPTPPNVTATVTWRLFGTDIRGDRLRRLRRLSGRNLTVVLRTNADLIARRPAEDIVGAAGRGVRVRIEGRHADKLLSRVQQVAEIRRLDSTIAASRSVTR